MVSLGVYAGGLTRGRGVSKRVSLPMVGGALGLSYLVPGPLGDFLSKTDCDVLVWGRCSVKGETNSSGFVELARTGPGGGDGEVV